MRSAAALLACLWPAALLAQTRPLLTEQADTAPAGTLVLEAGADFIASEPNFLTGHERDRWNVPVLRLVWSPADRVEMDLEWVGRVIARGDPDFGNVSDWGDITLRSKVRLSGGRPGRPAVGARFAVTLPETSFGNGLGPNTLRMSAEALLSADVADLRVHLNAGVSIQDEPLRPHEQRDLFAYGLAFEYPLDESLALLGEVTGLLGDGMPGADAHSELRGGLRYGGRIWRIDAALRRGLAEADGTWGFTAGLSWRIRAR